MPTEDCPVRWAGPHAVVAMPAEIDAVNAGKIRQGLLSAVGKTMTVDDGGIPLADWAFAMRGAGCTWNDIVDRDLDRGVERTRSRSIEVFEKLTGQGF